MRLWPRYAGVLVPTRCEQQVDGHMIVRAVSAVTLLGWVLLGPSPLAAQPSDRICTELEDMRPGEFLHSQTDMYLTTSTLRPLQEPPSVGRSVVKGAMAQRLSDALDSGPVWWSAALLSGPLACSGFNAYQIQVDPSTVRIAPH